MVLQPSKTILRTNSASVFVGVTAMSAGAVTADYSIWYLWYNHPSKTCRGLALFPGDPASPSCFEDFGMGSSISLHDDKPEKESVSKLSPNSVESFPQSYSIRACFKKNLVPSALLRSKLGVDVVTYFAYDIH